MAFQPQMNKSRKKNLFSHKSDLLGKDDRLWSAF